MGQPKTTSAGRPRRRKSNGRFQSGAAPAGAFTAMRKIIPVLSLLITAAWALPVTAKVLDRTIATVNSQAILLSEFQKNADPILEQFKRGAPEAEQTPERVADLKK